MKHRFLLLNILILASLLLGACGTPATEAPPPEPEVVPTEVPAVVEPTAVPVVEEPVVEEPMGLTEADLDSAFAVFLADMSAYNTIGIDSLGEMLAEEPPPYILDVREPGELEEKGWIPGAVNIPLREIADHIDLLPSFDTTIVSYCGSGWRCTIALTALEAMGWENVLGLKGGSFGGWVEAGYPVDTGGLPGAIVLDVATPDPAVVAYWDEVLTAVPEGYGVATAENLNTELVENPDLLLIDGRTAPEVDSKGYIDGENVVFLPLEDFVSGKSAWPTDLDTPIVVYCGSGHRSTIAMTMLWAYGYTDVRSLKGGYGGWLGAGYATVGGEVVMEADLDTGFSIFLADMEAYNTVGLDSFNLMLAEDEEVFILDVRQPDELLANGWIEGAVNIPLRELGENIDLLPSFDTTIVSYCGSGWRCTIALTALEGMGWENVLGLKGGSFGGWVAAGYPFAEGDEIPVPAVYDIAMPDLALWGVMDEMFVSIPEGYGVVTADALNAELVENADLILIDVRRPEELEANGIIESANFISIPLEQFIEMQEMWPADYDAPIVIYCGSGHRSTIAMTMLWTYGFSDVHSLKGGIGGWIETGYPVVEFAAP